MSQAQFPQRGTSIRLGGPGGPLPLEWIANDSQEALAALAPCQSWRLGLRSVLALSLRDELFAFDDAPWTAQRYSSSAARRFWRVRCNEGLGGEPSGVQLRT